MTIKTNRNQVFETLKCNVRRPQIKKFRKPSGVKISKN